MSNTLAIAAVTSTIKYVLNQGLALAAPDEVNGAVVSTWRPAQLTDADTIAENTTGLNVYLYQVSPNHAWNLTDLPTRNRDGTLARRPLAALDLHYLITAYGDEEALEPQRLLATATLALARTPVFGREVIAEALALYDTGATDFLDLSDLPDQPEPVKVSPTPLSLEELSKLWGALGTPYLLSLAYTATVVLIEAPVPVRRALPVRQRNIDVRPFARVVLDSVTVAPVAGRPVPAATGRTLVLTGSGLLSTSTRVQVGPVGLVPEDGASSQRLEVVLTDAVPAGVHGLQVVHIQPADPMAGTPERVIGRSSAMPVVVVPTVGVVAEAAGVVEVPVTPSLQADQRATVSFGRIAGGEAEEQAMIAASFPPVAATDAPLATLEVDRARLTDGTWLVRVSVDGAESVPELGGGGTYGTPVVVLA